MPSLIHGSQTGFVQDRCILDNVFTFHAAVDWTRTSIQPLAIILLDLEKAYDRVDRISWRALFVAWAFHRDGLLGYLLFTDPLLALSPLVVMLARLSCLVVR